MGYLQKRRLDFAEMEREQPAMKVQLSEMQLEAMKLVHPFFGTRLHLRGGSCLEIKKAMVAKLKQRVDHAAPSAVLAHGGGRPRAIVPIVATLLM